MSRKKQLLIFILSIIGSVLVIFCVNILLHVKVLNADLNMQSRGIENITKLILNGYLSAFFRFSYLGNITWLLFPITLIYYYVFKPKWDRKEYFILAVLICSLLLIGAKGFFNPRYAYTLMALLIFFVFDFTWNITNKSSFKWMKYVALIALNCFIFWNFYREAIQVRFERKIKEIFTEQTDQPTQQLQNIAENKEVENLFEYIEKMDYNGNYLVDNGPEFYYHTTKKGIYYWNADDMVFDKSNRWILMKDITDSDVVVRLNDSLNCKYIFSYTFYEGYNPRFDGFLDDKCTLMAKDKANRLLYRINKE